MSEDGLRIPPDLGDHVVVAKRGDVVFVESARVLTHEQMAAVGEALKNACERYGVQIVVLPPGMKVARAALHETEPDAGGTGEHTKDGT